MTTTITNIGTNSTIPVSNLDTNTLTSTIDTLNTILETDVGNKLVLDLAQKLDISWVTFAIQLGLAFLLILLFKEIVISIYNYLLIRLDQHIGIGANIKFNHSIDGKIVSYNLRSLSIQTANGIVKIPLGVWLSTYYTHVTPDDSITNNQELIKIKNINIDQENEIQKLKEINKSHEDKLQWLYNTQINLVDRLNKVDKSENNIVNNTDEKKTIETIG